MDWLARAFGFVEAARWLDLDGRLSHGEMTLGDGRIMLATPMPAYESPRHHREQCAPVRTWSEAPWVIEGMLVYVHDVQAHYAQAKNAGARILGELEAGPPGKRYRVEDLESHRIKDPPLPSRICGKVIL